jgi:hypothetical protein
MSAPFVLAIDFRSGEVSHELERDRLVVRYAKDGRTESVPFGTIREINLRQEMAGIYSVHITRDGGATIRIPSRHFRGLGKFDDRVAEYATFVRALLTAAKEAGARVTAGSSALYVLGWITIAMGVVAVAMVVIGSIVRGELPPVRGLFVLPIAFFVGIGFLRQGGRRPVDPASPPPAVFPS